MVMEGSEIYILKSTNRLCLCQDYKREQICSHIIAVIIAESMDRQLIKDEEWRTFINKVIEKNLFSDLEFFVKSLFNGKVEEKLRCAIIHLFEMYISFPVITEDKFIERIKRAIELVDSVEQDESTYIHYVGSSQGDGYYNIQDGICSCPDFEIRGKTDKNYYCKHKIAVLISNGQIKKLFEIFKMNFTSVSKIEDKEWKYTVRRYDRQSICHLAEKLDYSAKNPIPVSDRIIFKRFYEDCYLPYLSKSPSTLIPSFA
jgi:predicted nucleic acid-binding Zn finger protein